MNKKRQYKKPEIVIHGDLQSITKSTGTTGPNDGETFTYPST